MSQREKDWAAVEQALSRVAIERGMKIEDLVDIVISFGRCLDAGREWARKPPAPDLAG